ncbi:MAG TPA: hypothetical protein VMJ10_17745 [Kofleriaceae bacterium]|nr:hypothetical protein [Kofleriaceae bacterium]
MYRCERCGAIYVREPGKKLVPYAQWKQGDGLPAARVVSYDRTDEST